MNDLCTNNGGMSIRTECERAANFLLIVDEKIICKKKTRKIRSVQII